MSTPPTDYKKKTVKELKEIAKAKKITGYSKMSKPELVEALTLPKQAVSSLEKDLIAAVENARKSVVSAQDMLRVAEENLEKFRITKNNPTTRKFQITVDMHPLKYNRLVSNINEVKEVLTEVLLKPRGENPSEYTFKYVDSWMKKAKVSKTSVEISVDGNDFFIGSNGYTFGAFIKRIS
jgi:hypothetical protein